MKTLNISIISKEGISYQGLALQATIPTLDGIITVLPEHNKLISALKKGEIIVKKEDKTEERFPTEGGVLEIKSNSQVIILRD